MVLLGMHLLNIFCNTWWYMLIYHLVYQYMLIYHLELSKVDSVALGDLFVVGIDEWAYKWYVK